MLYQSKRLIIHLSTLGKDIYVKYYTNKIDEISENVMYILAEFYSTESRE